MKFKVEITQLVEVELDETKFTDTFMTEFRDSFYPFYDLKDHAEHIAQLQARGLIDIEGTPEFIEGYGPSESMGLTAKVTECETDVVS